MKRALPLAALGLLLALRGGLVPRPAALADLPVVEVEPRGAPSELLAVLISGDGGWASLARHVAAALAARGVPVLGLDSPRYFWTRRSPAEAGAALTRMLDHALARWPRRRALLVGYSRGADALPFMVNRLPARLRARLALVALLGPGRFVEFEFHLSDWFRERLRPGAAAVGPEVARLRGVPILCVYGARERGSLCPRLPAGLAALERRPGGHHFGGDYRALAERILAAASAAGPRARAGRRIAGLPGGATEAHAMPKIDAERLLADLRALRAIGATGPGVVRPAFSAEDMAARHWLAARYAEAGLEPEIDGVGNVLGRSRSPGPALLIGSHSDTQPTGGWLDGALGVIYGLEVVRALAEDPATRGLAIDAVSWQDEEARFFGCLGSRSFCGLLEEQDEESLTDRGGVSLAEALRQAQLAGVPRARLTPGRYRGFLEAHIEQGPNLESTGNRLGVVNSIVGLGGRVFRFRGQQNHAGTTSMQIRRDAATALFELAHAINQSFPQVASERSVWTMGRVRVEPGAPSIVPGFAELELQFRDPSPQVLQALGETADRLAQEVGARSAAHLEAQLSRAPIAPTELDADLQGQLAAAAERHAPGRWLRLPSGAFHDAGIVAAVLPSAMLFIPSIGGISHDFAEDSHEADIVLGCQVLADAAAGVLLGAAAGA